MEFVGASVGPWHLRALVGQGGYGLVYEAEEHATQQTVALKTVQAEVDCCSSKPRAPCSPVVGTSWLLCRRSTRLSTASTVNMSF